MWAEHFAGVCRRHGDLAAVFESQSGQLALLLRHTLVPLTEERQAWLRATRKSTREVIGDLRAAGLQGKVRVLQWLPLAGADEIMQTWTCRYERDAARRAQLAGTARRYVLDERFLAACATRRVRTNATPRMDAVTDSPASRPRGRTAVGGDAPDDWRRPLARWYRAMVPSWLSVTPWLRRKLMFETHFWLAAHVIGSLDRPAPPIVDLTDGDLGRALAMRIPATELDDWRPWLQLVFVDLRQALSRAEAARDERWGRWLFLIPYSIPAPRPAWPTAVSGRQGLVSSAGASSSVLLPFTVGRGFGTPSGIPLRGGKHGGLVG